MTSEVVVMNKLGIALASDSAATVHVAGRAKIYHANKLFMLSDRHPVGVMVYNNSSLLGVPWETILKLFRTHRGGKKFDKLSDYGANLIDFLNNNNELFPEKVQLKHYLSLISTFFRNISKAIEKEVYVRAIDEYEDGPEFIKAVQSEIIKKQLDIWRSKGNIDSGCFTAEDADKLASQQSGAISDLIARHFPHIGSDLVSMLTELSRLVVYKDEILPESLSGIVIAGFGDKDFFPVMQEYEVGEIFLGKLKYKCICTSSIDSDTPSVVRPFAQSEMVETFLNGISPALDLQMMREVVKLALESPEEIIDGMEGVGAKRKQAYKDKVRPISAEAAKSLVHRLREFRKKKHLQPILQSIEFLPKNELAHVAASLVNLSSFQKRMSTNEDETVGGPIDVAVISKGDGFVWIERKHYFKSELNRHFFRNHGLPTNKSSDIDNEE